MAGDPVIPDATSPAAATAARGTDGDAGAGAARPASDLTSTIPKETTPTWELEMLISGAVVFGLLQLPGVVDAGFDRLLPRLGGEARYAARLGYIYMKSGLYVLIVAFLVHLAARAYWVALVGLHSVFPAGVRWERSTMGPIAREVWRERLPSIATTIERVDNFASTVFAVGFSIVWLLAYSVLGVAVAVLIPWGLSRLLGVQQVLPLTQITLVAILLVPVVALAIDRRIGHRLRRGGLPWRMVRGVARTQYRVQGQSLFGPAFLTLLTASRKRGMYFVLFGAMFGCLALTFFTTMSRRGELGADSYRYLPTGAEALTVHSRYYADQRTSSDAFSTLPSIQSDIVREPYVRLFIPYRPSEHNPALERSCPELGPLAGRGVGGVGDDAAAQDRVAAIVLGCLARIHRVTLNGEPLAGLEFRLYTQPGTGLRGILAYIPVAGLPKGRNVLTVAAPQAAERDAAEEGPREYVIPFWI